MTDEQTAPPAQGVPPDLLKERLARLIGYQVIEYEALKIALEITVSERDASLAQSQAQEQELEHLRSLLDAAEERDAGRAPEDSPGA